MQNDDKINFLPSGPGPDENLSCVAKREHMSDAPTNRIVGGNVGNFAPYQIFYGIMMKESKEVSGCGGTILNNRHILTARHCVILSGKEVNPKTADIKVVVGETDWCKAIGLDDIDVLYLADEKNISLAAPMFTGKFENVKDVADVYIHSEDDLAIIKVGHLYLAHEGQFLTHYCLLTF